MEIRRLIIDVLVPQEPSVLEYAQRISDVDGVEAVTIRVAEIDERTKTVEMTIEGQALSFEAIEEVIEGLGGSVHSIDKVSAGTRIV